MALRKTPQNPAECPHGNILTLWWHGTGPLIQYDKDTGVLIIEDLNPEQKVRWAMNREELLMLGRRCIWAAGRPD